MINFFVNEKCVALEDKTDDLHIFTGHNNDNNPLSQQYHSEICKCKCGERSWQSEYRWRLLNHFSYFLKSTLYFPQARKNSQSEAVVLQAIRNAKGNNFCVDCNAPSE